VDTEGNVPADLFDIDAWQPSVVETIEEYIRLRGKTSLRQAERREQGLGTFAHFLDQAHASRSSLKAFDLAAAGLAQDDWLCIVGVNAVTRVRLKIQRLGRSPDFVFSSSDRVDKWGEPHQEQERLQTGDGTVPLRAAIPHFLSNENIVCVRPADFGYWEIADILALQFGGFHGLLPNMDMLHRLIVRFFKERADPRGNTWGAPLPGVTESNWSPPLKGGLRHRA
jgi:hypothetical protein